MQYVIEYFSTTSQIVTTILGFTIIIWIFWYENIGKNLKLQFGKEIKDIKVKDFYKNFEKLMIVNIDISIVLQRPKIVEYKESMIKNLATNLFLKKDQINIKATTGEGLGFIGREEGVICYAIALLKSR